MIYSLKQILSSKTAMNIMGMNVGKLRLPLYKMDTKNEETLVNTLKKYNLV